MANPILHPVMEKVFERELQVITRPQAEGRDAQYVCSWGANIMCSYTSSVITKASYFTAKPTMNSNSSFVKTFPQGFDGLHTMIAFTLFLKASSNFSLSKEKAGGTKSTYMGFAPLRMASAP